MSDVRVSQTDRRGFLTAGAAAAALSALATMPTWVEAQGMPQLPPEVDQNQGWLKPIRTKYRQFFETPKATDFIPLHHVNNYYKAWQATAGVHPGDMTAVLGVTLFAVPMVFGDALWAKYPLGKTMGVVDATGAPYTRNPFLDPQNGELYGSPELSIAGLQRTGAKVILCNNAFGFWLGMIAGATNQQVPAVRAEFLAQLAPGVTLVPAMVQAVEQAQRWGLTYFKNG